MAVRLRNMTSLYITGEKGILCLYRIGSRVVGNSYTGSAGGHIEADEYRDPKACVLRELQEETGIDRGEFRYICRNWDHAERYMYEGFYCVTDYPKDQIRCQPGETSGYKWLSLPEFLVFFDMECLPRMRNRLVDFVDTLRPKG